MPEMTPHIGLKKPLLSETADISVINDNMDMIDTALGDLSAVPTSAKDAAGAITELHEAIKDIDVEIPNGSITPAKLSFDPATQTELDAHVNATNVHGATNAPTASRLIIRDAAGRAKVAAPAASDDIARLDSITKTQAGLGSVDNYGTATQAEAEVGTATNKFMTPQRTKQYVDKRLLNNIIWRINNGSPEWSADGGATWKGAGQPVYKNPVTSLSTVNITSTSVQNLLSVSGKKGAFSSLTVNGGGALYPTIFRIKIDGVTKFAYRTSNIGGIGLIIGDVGSNNIQAFPNAFIGDARWTSVAQQLPYPYVNETTDVLSGYARLPSKIPFESSLEIEMQSTGSTGYFAIALAYETE
ncbi:hypothetical protein [Cohnella sp.]|uniref:hypothetical protein n=1 Tax=Cohnella sp. TaxID=1883426 RepID=UPI0037047A09